MTIVEFLEARLLEDEAVANGALHHPQTYNKVTQDFDQTGTDDGSWYTSSFCDPSDQRMVEGVGITIYDEGGHSADQAAHIARHDPARIFREVAAKRAILAQEEAARSQFEHVKSSTTYPAIEVLIGQVAALATVIRHLASAYADHPDFNPDWAE